MLRIKKVGHAGTLDPLATGLLIVCTGKFTKKINEYMAVRKEYEGTIILGAVTPTYDMEAEPFDFKDYSFVSEDQVHLTAEQFKGEINQLPPVFSAIKKDGVALYELARKGKTVHLEPRRITIYDFTITCIELPVISFRVTCSTGTYIRSLAHDFGKVLGCGAYLGSLRRTKIGALDVTNAMTIDEFTQCLKENTFRKNN